MDSFGIVAFVPDTSTPLANRLITSIHRFNAEDLPIHYLLDGGSLEREKFDFATTGELDHYLVVDERLEFLRPFTRRDFMLDDDHSFLSATAGDEMRIDPHFPGGAWEARLAAHQAAATALEVERPVDLAMPEFATFSSSAVRDLLADLTARGWAIEDALARVPQAEAWYLAWQERVDRRLPSLREPNVKVLQSRQEYLGYIVRGVLDDDLARGYVAAAHEIEDLGLSLGDPNHRALARLLTRDELLGAIKYRLHRKVVVEKEPFKRARVRVGAAALHIPLVRNYVDIGQNSPAEI